MVYFWWFYYVGSYIVEWYLFNNWGFRNDVFVCRCWVIRVGKGLGYYYESFFCYYLFSIFGNVGEMVDWIYISFIFMVYLGNCLL